MADSVMFYRTLISNVQTYMQAMEQLNIMQDRMVQDSTLAAAAAASARAAGRLDLNTVDFTNLGNAIVQLAFTYNSGNPTQKSFLYKLL